MVLAIAVPIGVTIGLVAGYLSHYGEGETLAWLKGLKENLARNPDGNDRAQIKGIGAGECGIGLSNSYYYGVMLNDPDQEAQAKQAKLIFPTFDKGNENFGTHVNISGIGLVNNSDNKDEAEAFISFMLSDAAQAIYAEVNHEYPVKAGVAASDLVRSWGQFKSDPTALEEIAALRKRATELVDEIGFNDGPSS